MTAKEIFLQNGDDVKFMLGVVSNPAFSRAVIYARQQWLDSPTRPGDPITAISTFVAVLYDLPIDDKQQIGVPRPNIHHDLDVGRRTSQTPVKGKKK